MTKIQPSVSLNLSWDNALKFKGRSGIVDFVLDSACEAGPSPMQAVAFGLAGCMAVDVVHSYQRPSFVQRCSGDP